jgi:hypothetical protein
MLDSLKLLNDLCNECWPVAPKPVGFRALDIETSLGLNYSSQKSYEA